MILLHIFAVLVCLLVDYAFAVVELTDQTFYDYAKNKEVLLVDFFAPWCSDCKALDPDFESASAALGTRSFDLAKVDCFGAGKALCDTYGVRRWPTLKNFNRGTYTGDYNGGLSAGEIAGYITTVENSIAPSTTNPYAMVVPQPLAQACVSRCRIAKITNKQPCYAKCKVTPFTTHNGNKKVQGLKVLVPRPVINEKSCAKCRIPQPAGKRRCTIPVEKQCDEMQKQWNKAQDSKGGPSIAPDLFKDNVKPQSAASVTAAVIPPPAPAAPPAPAVQGAAVIGSFAPAAPVSQAIPVDPVVSPAPAAQLLPGDQPVSSAQRAPVAPLPQAAPSTLAAAPISAAPPIPAVSAVSAAPPTPALQFSPVAAPGPAAPVTSAETTGYNPGAQSNNAVPVLSDPARLMGSASYQKQPSVSPHNASFISEIIPAFGEPIIQPGQPDAQGFFPENNPPNTEHFAREKPSSLLNAVDNVESKGQSNAANTVQVNTPSSADSTGPSNTPVSTVESTPPNVQSNGVGTGQIGAGETAQQNVQSDAAGAENSTQLNGIELLEGTAGANAQFSSPFNDTDMKTMNVMEEVQLVPNDNNPPQVQANVAFAGDNKPSELELIQDKTNSNLESKLVSPAVTESTQIAAENTPVNELSVMTPETPQKTSDSPVAEISQTTSETVESIKSGSANSALTQGFHKTKSIDMLPHDVALKMPYDVDDKKAFVPTAKKRHHVAVRKHIKTRR